MGRRQYSKVVNSKPINSMQSESEPQQVCFGRNQRINANKSHVTKSIFFFKFYFYYLLLRERQSVSREGAEREMETQNPKKAPGSGLLAQSPMWGSNP